MNVSDELRDLADQLIGDRPTEEQWHAGAQNWIDRATALLGGSGAFMDWIVPRVWFWYSRPSRACPPSLELGRGDPRTDGTPAERAHWLDKIESYAWRQIVAGITPDLAVQETMR
jgi:hypothetical protein